MINITREDAIKLRKKGMTFSEIQKLLNVKLPKSTLSNWLKNVVLSDKAKNRIKKLNARNLERARTKALSSNRNKRDDYFKKLKHKNLHLLESLDLGTQKIMLSILYLGEGAKYKSTRYLRLGSSDPRIIQLFLSLLNNCFPIEKEKFRVRIQCRADQKIHDLEKFWRELTGLEEKYFYPTYVDKRTVSKKTKLKNYKGVCSIYYLNTAVQLELEILSNSLIDQIVEV